LEVHDAPGRGRHSARTEAIEGRLARRGRWWTVSHSTATRADVERRWRIGAARSVMFPLGVATDRFAVGTSGRQAWREGHGIPPDAVVVLCVARLVASKRVDLLLRAVALLPQGAVHVVIVGDGPQRAALGGLAAESGIDEHVSFVGGLAYEEVPDAMGAADVLVSASGYEGFGLTITEAMAAGLPVVATAVGGVTDLVVDEVTGLLVGAGDARQLAGALAQLAAQPAVRAQMGASGRARAVSSFAIANFADDFSELYLRMIHPTTP
jgi:glycosyltransferase involved in cell wall biosynthesis